VANSLVAYQTRPIAPVVDAVSVLGFNTFRQLVLGLSLLEENRSGACLRFDYQDFWAQSLLTAITAQNLVMQSGVGATEEVFILGLLGQIGSLALATVLVHHPENILLHTLQKKIEVRLGKIDREKYGIPKFLKVR
jgi:HD-like signal output (HDOD) protein